MGGIYGGAVRASRWAWARRPCGRAAAPIAPDDKGADRNGHAEAPSAPSDIAYRTSVGPPPYRLELVDDLHRPDLGRTRHGSRGKAGGQGGHGIELCPKPSSYFA